MPNEPEKIGKYEVIGVIGRGGMGVVYKGFDRQLDRFVAIKMITSGFAGNPELLKRFEQEARATGNLQNPNIVTIYDSGNQDGNPYLVMEFLEGTTLEAVINAHRSLTLVEKLGVIVDVCHGLSYAHQRGLIHRDIKPGNIMLLNDGVAKIVDFGIARMGDNRMTRTDQVIGSIQYMSPEQLHNQPLDPRTDIFATGVVLYQLLTNVLPFDANETAATLLKIIQDPPPPLSNYIQDFPQELEAIISRALAKKRDDRYASAKDLAFDVLRVQEEIKQDAVAHLLGRAEKSVQKGAWSKAKDELQQILRIDRQHTKAHRLLREVQVNLEKQTKMEMSRRLRTEAEEALASRRFDEALRLSQQAIGLDASNQELRAFHDSVVAAKTKAEKLQKALRRAEASHKEGDLEHASVVLEQALALEPNDTQAKALKVIIAHELQAQARKEAARALLNDARNQLAAREISTAFEILQRAESLDPGSSEVQSLMKAAIAARDQKSKKADLDSVNAEIQDALSREDYEAAISIANQALQRHPGEQGLLRLKTLSETQQQRIFKQQSVQKQLAAANSLLDSGQLVEALSIVDELLAAAPDDSSILALRGTIRQRLSAEQSHEQRLHSLQSASDALAARRFADAIRILETEVGDLGSSAEASELLEKARAGNAKERAITEALAAARELIEKGQLNQADQFLASALQRVSSQRLVDLQVEVRRQIEQLNRGLKSAILEAETILKEHGSADALKFVEAQPQQYSTSSDFQSLLNKIQKAQVAESLDVEIAKIASPDGQLRVLEEALAHNPDNEEIGLRLSALQEKRKVIRGVLDQAQAFEANRQYSDAVQELSRVRKIHAPYPDLEREVARLTQLETQQRALANKSKTSTRTQPPPIHNLQDSLAETQLLDRRPPADPPIQSNEATGRVSQPPKTSKTILWLLTAVIGVAIVIAIVYFRRPSSPSVESEIPVRIQTNPSASDVTINGFKCRTPCDLRLKPGTYQLTADHDGYQQLDQTVSITAGGDPFPTYNLVKIEAAKPSSAPLPTMAEPRQGKLMVKTAVAGTEIYADNVLQGQTDQRGTLELQLDRGPHDIQVKKDGYAESRSKQVEVVEDGERTVAFKLAPLTNSPSSITPPTVQDMFLSIQTSPGARVSIDQQSAGQAVNGSMSTQIRPGNHIVTLTLDGYRSRSEAVTGRAGEHISRNWELEKVVNAYPRPTATLTASPSSVERGQAVRLEWTTHNASEVTLDGRPVPPSGSRQVIPADSTTYSLIARGSGGDASASFPVAVIAPVPPKAARDIEPSSSSSVVDDKAAVLAILAAYARSYETTDPDLLRKLWPGMSSQTMQGVADFFRSASSVKLSYIVVNNPRITGDEASLDFKQEISYVMNGKFQKPISSKVNMRLSKANSQGTWNIESIHLEH